MAWTSQDILGMDPSMMPAGFGTQPSSSFLPGNQGLTQVSPQANNPLATLLQGLMGGGGVGGMGQGQPPMMQILQQLLPQLLQQQQSGQRAPISQQDMQRFLMFQGMQNSPFYQGQQRGGGLLGSLNQAIMPFLMARAQAPMMAQQYNAQQQTLQGKGLETIMKAMTAMMGLQTAQAESQRATAQANKTNLEAQNIPQELAIKQAAKAETERHQREMERISTLTATEKIAATKEENKRQQENVNSLIAYREWKKANPNAGEAATGLDRSYAKVGDKWVQTVLNKKTNTVEYARTKDGQLVEVAPPPGYIPGGDYVDQQATQGSEGGMLSGLRQLWNAPSPGVAPTTPGVARGSNPSVPPGASPVSDNQKPAGKSVAPPPGKKKPTAPATGTGKWIYDPETGDYYRE